MSQINLHGVMSRKLKRLVPQVEDELPAGSVEERLGDAVRFYSPDMSEGERRQGLCRRR